MPDSEDHADIIIAGASVRSLAKSALTCGLRPICIDLFCDADLRRLISQAGLSEFHVRQISSFDQVKSQLADVDERIPLLPVGGFEFCYDELEQIETIRQILAMPNHVTAELVNPAIVFPTLKAAGIFVPDFFSLTPCANDRGSALRSNNQPADESSACFSTWPTADNQWLKKNGLSSGGHSVHRIPHEQLQHVAAQLEPTEFLQQEIIGVPCSATFFIPQDGAAVLLGCAIQLCGEEALNATGFQFCGNAGPLQFHQSAISQLQRIATCLQTHWPLTGVFGIDFIWNAGNLFVIEINPRLTASHEIHESQHFNQPNHLQLHCSAFQSRRFDIDDSAVWQSTGDRATGDRVQCRWILYSDQTLTVTPETTARLAGHQRSDSQQGGHFWFSDIPEAETVIEASTPFCSINLTVDRIENLPAEWLKIQQHIAAAAPMINTHAMHEMVGRLQTRMIEIQGFCS